MSGCPKELLLSSLSSFLGGVLKISVTLRLHHRF